MKKKTNRIMCTCMYLVFILSFMIQFGCEYNSTEDTIPILGQKDDYHFENDIEVFSEEDVFCYVANHLTYVVDQHEYWQLPEESFERRYGDCEDFCIFAMYLLYEKLHITSNLYLLRSRANNRLGHAVVEVDGNFYSAQTSMKAEREELFLKFEIIEALTYHEVMWVTYFFHGLKHI